MNILAINGSPRKNGSTAQLLQAALQGTAAAGGGMTEMIHLSDYDFQGCRSCYGCKDPVCGCEGLCIRKDAVTPVYESIRDGSVVILGSPVYFHYLSGLMKNFLERLLFPYHTQGADIPENVQIALILTMSQTEENYYKRGYDRTFEAVSDSLRKTFGNCEQLNVYDTYHFIDEDKIRIRSAKEVLKRKEERYRKEFDTEKERAMLLGKQIMEKALKKEERGNGKNG